MPKNVYQTQQIIPKLLKKKTKPKPKLQRNSSPFHLSLNNVSVTTLVSMHLASALQRHNDNTDGLVI